MIFGVNFLGKVHLKFLFYHRGSLIHIQTEFLVDLPVFHNVSIVMLGVSSYHRLSQHTKTKELKSPLKTVLDLVFVVIILEKVSINSVG